MDKLTLPKQDQEEEQPKRSVGRPPQMVLHIDAKPEDIAWALTNTSPKDIQEWKDRKAQNAQRD